MLTPGFVHGDGHGIGKIQTAVVRPHRQADPLVVAESCKNLGRQSACFRSEQQRVSRLKTGVHMAAGCLARECIKTAGNSLANVKQRIMDLHLGPFVIVQAGPPKTRLIQFETEWSHQVQSAAGVGGKANDISRVGRYFGLVKYDVKHGSPPRIWIRK